MNRLLGQRGLLAFGVVALVLVATACVPVGNPVVRQPAGSPRVWDVSDPFVMVADGQRYLFGSSNTKRVPVRILDNTTLAQSKTHWDRVAGNPNLADAMPSLPAWVKPDDRAIWAPTATRINGRFILYFAARYNGTARPGQEHNARCIGRAVSSNAMGPYTPDPRPLYCGERRATSNSWGQGAIDPEFFRAANGRPYLLVAMSDTTENIGIIPLTGDGFPTGGVNMKATTLLEQSLPYHDGIDDSTLNRRLAFLENPSMVYDPSTKSYLLFYSAGQWYTKDYVTGFARCETHAGPCTMDSRGPFLRNGNGRVGPGGFSVFRDTNGQLNGIYATWDARRVNPAPGGNQGGLYSRHGSLARIVVSTGTDPARQSITLQTANLN